MLIFSPQFVPKVERSKTASSPPAIQNKYFKIQLTANSPTVKAHNWDVLSETRLENKNNFNSLKKLILKGQLREMVF
jgi:hypothetical protein